jgi:hypothetical protein
MKSWKSVCLDYGIEAIIAWRIKSKNSSDMKMVSDIITLLKTHPHIHNFVIITGDIDLHELCRQIISAKRYVIGVSCFEASTSKLLKNVCSEYIVLDNIEKLKPSVPMKLSDHDLTQENVIYIIKEILRFHNSEKKMDLGLLKKLLLRYDSTFHEKKYGTYNNFREFIKHFEEFVVEESEKGVYHVRLRIEQTE